MPTIGAGQRPVVVWRRSRLLLRELCEASVRIQDVAQRRTRLLVCHARRDEGASEEESRLGPSTSTDDYWADTPAAGAGLCATRTLLPSATGLYEVIEDRHRALALPGGARGSIGRARATEHRCRSRRSCAAYDRMRRDTRRDAQRRRMACGEPWRGRAVGRCDADPSRSGAAQSVREATAKGIAAPRASPRRRRCARERQRSMTTPSVLGCAAIGPLTGECGGCPCSKSSVWRVPRCTCTS